MKKFDRKNLKVLRKDLDKVIAEVLSKHGLTHKIGSIRYGAEDFSCKLSVNMGNSDDIAEREFKRTYKYPLKNTDFGAEFNISGVTYVIVGILPKARKSTIICTTKSGGRFRLDATEIAKALGHEV